VEEKKRKLRIDTRVATMALIVSLAIWGYANYQLKKEERFPIKVEVETPEDFSLVRLSNYGVIITVEGPERVLDAFARLVDQVKLKKSVTVEKNDLKPRLVLDKSWLQAPDYILSNIVVKEFNPPYVDLELSRKRRKTKKVTAVTEGSVEFGYKVEKIVIAPTEVKVAGPEKVLDALSDVLTEPRSINGLAANKKWQFVPIQSKVRVSIDGVEQTATIDCRETVEVEVFVVMEEASRLLEDVEVAVLLPSGFPYPAEVREKSVNLMLRGAKLDIERLKPEDIIAYVDLRSMEGTTITPGLGESKLYKETVSVILPDGISLDESQPVPQVTVQLKRP